MSDPIKPGSVEQGEAAVRRLESWKEIASYLDRSPRTVRRWERDEGLPVHRHRHAKGSTVFAHVDELDRWLSSRVSRSEAQRPSVAEVSAPVESPPSAEAPGTGGRAFRWVAASSALALVLAVVALALSLSREDPVEPLDLWIRTIPVEQRLLLEASYFESRGNHAAALSALEAVVGVGPIGRRAIEAAERSCRALDDSERCTQLVLRAADESPEDSTLQAMAALALTRSGRSVEEALEYATRARRLGGGEQLVRDPELLAFVELLPARQAWLAGDVVRSAAELDRLMKTAADLEGRQLDAVARSAGWHCLALGRIGCADEWFSLVGSADERHELEGYTLFAAGRMDELAAHLAAGAVYRRPETAILLAMSGDPAAAERLIDGLDAGTFSDSALEIARGGLDLIGGRPAAARPRLQSGVDTIRPRGAGMHFIGLDMLSMIAAKTGELDHAAALLEMTDDQRERAILQGSGLFWIKCQTRLAEVYRSMDRVEDAVRVERELLTALALSDPEHPTTAALKRSST